MLPGGFITPCEVIKVKTTLSKTPALVLRRFFSGPQPVAAVWLKSARIIHALAESLAEPLSKLPHPHLARALNGITHASFSI